MLFWTKQIALKKGACCWKTPWRGQRTRQGQKKTLEHCFNAAGEIKALDRELACLLIRKVVVYPPDVMENTREIEIDWKF